ncbi:MAG: hypothetical protein JWM09_1291 [Francisellaceae bacterium]|nr:hypothetical protein [Francisellaceae bacterium]
MRYLLGKDIEIHFYTDSELFRTRIFNFLINQNTFISKSAYIFLL